MKDTEVFVGCLICGIKAGFSLYPDCESEAQKWGINLVKGIKTKEHIWTEVKAVKNWNEGGGKVSIKNAIQAGISQYSQDKKTAKINKLFKFYDDPDDGTTDFANGHWCVHRDEQFHRKLVGTLIEAIKIYEPYIYKDYQKPGREISYETIKGYSFIGRWLDDCDSPLYAWWGIQSNFCLICYREYGQLYFANNCKHVEKEKQNAKEKKN